MLFFTHMPSLFLLAVGTEFLEALHTTVTRLLLRLPTFSCIPDHWPMPWRRFYILLLDFTWTEIPQSQQHDALRTKVPCSRLCTEVASEPNACVDFFLSINSRLLSGTRALRRNTLNLMETGIKGKADEGTRKQISLELKAEEGCLQNSTCSVLTLEGESRL